MYKCKRLSLLDCDDAAFLANRVFFSQVMPSYLPQGQKDMMRYMMKKSDELALQIETSQRLAFGCYDTTGALCGMLVLQNTNHVALLYVDICHQGKGLGKELMAYAKGFAAAKNARVLTVNASDFAVGFYHKNGFVDTNFRQIRHGIVYTPMKCTL